MDTPLIPSNNPVNLAELAQGRRQMQPTGIGGAAELLPPGRAAPGHRAWLERGAREGEGSPRAGLLGTGGASPRPHNPRGRAAFSPSEKSKPFSEGEQILVGR